MAFFTKHKGTVVSVKFSAKEQKAVDEEVTRQLIVAHKQTEIDDTATILWILHTEFGFGVNRLRKVFSLLHAMNVEYEKKYLMERGDGAWLSRKCLKNYGVDVEQWLTEEKKHEISEYSP